MTIEGLGRRSVSRVDVPLRTYLTRILRGPRGTTSSERGGAPHSLSHSDDRCRDRAVIALYIPDTSILWAVLLAQVIFSAAYWQHSSRPRASQLRLLMFLFLPFIYCKYKMLATTREAEANKTACTSYFRHYFRLISLQSRQWSRGRIS